MAGFAVIGAGGRIENIIVAPDDAREFMGLPLVPVAPGDMVSVGDIYDPAKGFSKHVPPPVSDYSSDPIIPTE